MSRERGAGAERLLSVGQLSRLVASALAKVPAPVEVRGERVNIVRGTRGHLFAALRGDGVAIDASSTPVW
jgi:exonuclease VII large subunit